ncbi:hypothetical protein JCM10135_05480 [Stetteria hydrogenophila]
MGVDIESGKPGSSKARYSVAIVDGEGRLVYKASEAPLARIIRLAWDYRPSCIATDNVFELAENARDLARIASLLPPETDIVQVTAKPSGGMESLLDSARRAGVELDSKLTPSRTAYIAALIALHGGGSRVRFRGERVLVIVSKGRSPKGGGMSHERYMRRIRASVQRAARKIEEALERAGLDYDLTIRKGRGGYESAVFTVYAPREALRGVVRPHRGVDYAVSIKTVYEGPLEFGGEPGGGEAARRPVILGLDPGVSTGIAILDLNGEPLYVGSGKSLDRGSILSLVSRYGKPVMVAVDTSQVPEAVKKIAAQFNAEVYAPPEDLSVAEKSEIAQRVLGRAPRTPHERDALAAAYKAWLTVKGKVEKVSSYLGRIGLDLSSETVKESVLKGLTVAEAVERQIEKALAERLGGGRGEERRAQEQEAQAPRQCIDPSRIHELEAEKYALQRMVEERDRVIEELERELARLRRRARAEAEAAVRAELDALRARVEMLEGEIDRLRGEVARREDEVAEAVRLIALASRGEVLVPRVLPSATLSSIRREEESNGPLRPGDVVYVGNPWMFEREAVKALAGAGVQAVLLPEASGGLASTLERSGVPVFRLSDYLRGEFRGLLLLDARLRVDAERRRRELEEFRESEARLERLIEEYRRERARLLGREERA